MSAAIPSPKIESALPLAQDRLAALGPQISVPSYDRSALAPAVVHIGVGGFHRAHQGVYFDELAERGISSDWGIVGVGLRRPHMKAALAPQDLLYTVIERDPSGDRARVVGSMVDYRYAPENPEAVLGSLADPRTRIVTLTVTGGAYKLNPDRELDLEDPDVAADIANPGRPRTVPGYLVEGLRRRRAAGLRPFTVLSCDNLPANGRAIREAVVELAALSDEVLARWIENYGSFPSSVVDRITPITTEEDRALLARDYGVADRWPVMTEPFSQWIVEDDFVDGRPPLEEVGVEFVDDVAFHELTKKRLLNGSHCAIGYLGYLAGHRRIDAAIGDPVLRDFLTGLMEEEVRPGLPETVGIDLDAYRETLIERFSNPSVGDRLTRLAARGSVKMPAYLLPSLHDAIAEGRPHDRLALALAGWFHYLRGTDLEGEEIPVEDPIADRLMELARSGDGDPRPLLAEESIFGDLGRNEEFCEELQRAIGTVARHGVAGAVERIRESDAVAVAA